MKWMIILTTWVWVRQISYLRNALNKTLIIHLKKKRPPHPLQSWVGGGQISLSSTNEQDKKLGPRDPGRPSPSTRGMTWHGFATASSCQHVWPQSLRQEVTRWKHLVLFPANILSFSLFLYLYFLYVICSLVICVSLFIFINQIISSAPTSEVDPRTCINRFSHCLYICVIFLLSINSITTNTESSSLYWVCVCCLYVWFCLLSNYLFCLFNYLFYLFTYFIFLFFVYLFIH